MEKGIQSRMGKLNQDRKLYTKPKVEQVLLIPEENILGGCKNLTSINGPENTMGCTAPNACIM